MRVGTGAALYGIFQSVRVLWLKQLSVSCACTWTWSVCPFASDLCQTARPLPLDQSSTCIIFHRCFGDAAFASRDAADSSSAPETPRQR